MKVYAVIIEDRHTDAEVLLFSTPEPAIAYAKEYLGDFQDDDDMEYMDARELERAGWLFQATYSCEGDSIHVMPIEVDAEMGK